VFVVPIRIVEACVKGGGRAERGREERTFHLLVLRVNNNKGEAT
jgi:hypothetical protein